MSIFKILKRKAKHLKTETLALYYAARDPGTPWYARLLVAGIVAYAISPIDLIPDFIPILGYLDDLVLIPLGIMLAIRLIPEPILIQCRIKAQDKRTPVSQIAAGVIVLIWIVIVAAGLYAYRIWC